MSYFQRRRVREGEPRLTSRETDGDEGSRCASAQVGGVDDAHWLESRGRWKGRGRGYEVVTHENGRSTSFTWSGAKPLKPK